MRHVQEGKSGLEVSRLLGVSPATISRWIHRETLEASPKGGSKPRDLPVDLLEHVQNNPHKTVAQLAEGLPIKRSALLKRLHKAKITFKKKLHISRGRSHKAEGSS
jgi:transposase